VNAEIAEIHVVLVFRAVSFPFTSNYQDSIVVPFSCVTAKIPCFIFMIAPCINSIKTLFIVPTDAHYYKYRRM